MAITDIFRPTVLASALLAAGLALPMPGQAATITVASAVDDSLLNLAGNATCDLREAIQAANTDAAVGQCLAGSGADTIEFGIPGAGLHTIQLDSALGGELPAIVTDVTVDGYTQPGSSANSLANGTNAVLRVALVDVGGVVNGLHFTGLNAAGVVRGLIVGGFTYGIRVQSNNVGIHGNFIGNDGSGNLLANSRGVYASGGDSIAIGSSDIADRNLIAGNVTSGVYATTQTNLQIRNSLFGTQADGDTPLGANGSAIQVEDGTSFSILDNIVGSATNAVYIKGDASNATIARNRIGLGVGGGNIGAAIGVLVENSITGSPSSVLIGGLVSGEGNIIENCGVGVDVRYMTVVFPPPSGVRILANSIYNSGPGINLRDLVNNVNLGVDPNDAGDLDTGPNGFQNYPVVASATTDAFNTTVQFTLNSEANTPYRLEFFTSPGCDASGHGAGQVFLGAIPAATTDGAGAYVMTSNWSTPSTVGHFLTMTATNNTTGGTSEFSTCKAITAAAVQTPPVMGDVPDQTGTVGTPVSLDLAPYVTLTDGDPVMSYAVVGALPPGLSLDAASGVVSGTPTTAGIYNVTVTATDNDGVSNADAVQFIIAAAQQPGDVASIPTLSGWGLLLLSLLTSATGFFAQGGTRRRRVDDVVG